MSKCTANNNSKSWHDIVVMEDMFNEVVGRLANGEGLVHLCCDPDKKYPSAAGFLHWVNANPVYQNSTRERWSSDLTCMRS